MSRRASSALSLLLAAEALVSTALVSARAHAEPLAPRTAEPNAPATPQGTYSAYERATIDAALERLHRVVEPAPAGKIVEGVDVVPLDVFEPRDFMPKPVIGLVNWFHVTSRPYVIDREVLLRPGQRYDQTVADETARNLRGLGQLSLVLVLPVKGSDDAHVRLLVITKDLWSLRLNSNFTVADGKLQYLLLQPAEQNLLGTQQTVSGQFVLDPATYQFGAAYTIPRLDGSRVAATANANLILNKATGVVEGSYGGFSYGQPLYAAEAKWAWNGTISWLHEVNRQFSGGDVAAFAAGPKPPDNAIPWFFYEDILNGNYQVTRSFGTLIKHDITVGMSASRNLYRPPDLSAYSAAAAADFIANAIPRSDTQIGPFVQYHTYSKRYAKVLDFETIGLQEDVLIGHDAYLQLTPISTALRSTRSFLGVYAAAAYTVPFGDGIARALVETETELTTNGIPDGQVEVQARIASPRTPIGRLHFNARVLDRYKNYVNNYTAIGGDTIPRGYPTMAFRGSDVVAASLEYRSRAVELWGVQFGGAAFYDVGDAFTGFENMRIKQATGFGLRVLIPQAERVVLRLDCGFRLTSGVVPPGGFPGDIIFTFNQAFGLPGLPTGD